ncbi:MAG: DNA repair protein [Oscillospiraceae bacterium]|nr:DNA repair protein [Oscillospiraceae bacterium]MDY2847250.1 DNA repair protein [Oscillospiraceae bacterium]
MSEKYYACIDLKSFFASAECAERGLDPFKTNLAVTDISRGNGAITLAITPAMKALGVKNRCRVFEIPRNIDYIAAKPRMKLYMKYSADIYSVYLRYISDEDIHIYSIDEVFIDFTPYLKTYGMTPKELARRLMDEVYRETHITAAAGIGTNLFLAKIALDITAKHVPDNIGFLDEDEFKRTIWHHRPITDIWQIGRRTALRLEKYGIKDLHGVSCCDEKLLFREFGVNARYLIDHANGRESCTIADIKAYTPKSTSVSNGQILFSDYGYDDALTVLKEMTDSLVMELLERHMSTDSVSLYIGYSRDIVPPVSVTRRLEEYTNSYSVISAEFVKLYRENVRRDTPIRRLNIGFEHLSDEADLLPQLSFFRDRSAEERERRQQDAVLEIRSRYGKNAVLRGISLQENATARIRNKLVGGHNGE